MIEKKIPGKGWEGIVYNKLDLVAFTQDAVQAAAPEPGPYRSFIKYDGLGRVIMTGVEKGHLNSRQALQDIVDANPFWESRDNSTATGYTNNAIPGNLDYMEIMVLNYYDDYTAPGIPDNQSAAYSNKTKGLLTATKRLVLGTGNYLWTVNYYDDEGRVVKVWQQHYKGGVVAANSYDETGNTYNFAGELVNSTRKHYVSGVQKLHVYNEYTYDHMGRKIYTKQRTGDNAATTNPLVYLSKNTYNELGQQLGKSLHSTNAANFAQTVRYKYNPRGWLTEQAAPLFTQQLRYELDSVGLVPQYNGNISMQKWGTSTLVNKQYTYGYDKLNRLLSAVSHDGNDETIAYSLMGNITSLQRKSLTNVVDQLTYSYNGNRLTSVADANANTSASFQLPGTTAYTYDGNGNMITRISITSAANNMYDMGYNHLNLPTNINANGAVITYTYDANGTKLKKLVSGNASVNNEYISGIQYVDGALTYVTTEVGRVRRISATSYSYEYMLTDHLGNGRMYFDISGGAVRKIQETDYYAFGLDIQRSLVGTENKYQYNGKEKQDQEKMFDYGARFYDPVIGRWNVVDKLAEHPNQIDKSPYAYAWNNPVKLTDPDGNCPWCPIIYLLGELTTTQIITSAVIAGGASYIITNGVNQYNRNSNYSVQDEGLSRYQIKPQSIVKSEEGSSPDKVKSPPNPDGSKGKPDHQGKVAELVKKAQSETKPGEQVLSEKKIQGQESKRRPDVQIVDKDGKARKVLEAERRPNSQRNIKREEEYKKLGIEQETHKVGN